MLREPEYLAVEAVAKENSPRVFWHHEVEEIEAQGKRAWPHALTS